MKPFPALAAALAAGLALPGCITYRFTDDGLSRARFGETVAVGPARVTPLTLVEDSRCPQGVQCVWAGRVRITARVQYGASAQSHELTLGQPLAVPGGQLELAEVLPAARQDARIEPAAYRFGFRHTGAG